MGYRPGSSPRWVITVGMLAGLICGACVAAIAAWVGWRGAGPLPTNEQAVAIVQDVLPDQRVDAVQRRDEIFAYEHHYEAVAERWRQRLFGDDDYIAGYVEVTTSGQDDFAAVQELMRQRLRADSWRVGPRPWGEGFTARGGDAVIEVSPARDGSSGESAATGSPGVVVEYRRVEPARVPVLTVLGGAVGAVAGWLLAGWLARRLRTRSDAVRSNVVVLCAGGVLLLLPVTVVAVIDMAYRALWVVDTLPPQPAWEPYTFVLLRVPALFGVLGLVWAVLLAVGPLPRRMKRSLPAASVP